VNQLDIIIAKYAIAIPVIVAIVVFFTIKTKQERIRYAVTLVAGGILALLLARIGSALWYDPRPFVVSHLTPLIPHAADNGFPSDHTLLAAFIGWTTLSYARKTGIGILLIAALIGAARVFAHVHHTSDIIGSFVISGIATLIVVVIVRFLPTKKKAPPRS